MSRSVSACAACCSATLRIQTDDRYMATKRCAFLTMENTEGWFIDADLAIPPMQALGWIIDSVAWRGPEIEWERYDAVYIETPWDYPEDVGRFMRLLEQIDGSGSVLVNDLELVRWGIAKTYLRDLEARGADIVPSLWYEGMSAGRLTSCFDALTSDVIVIKPAGGCAASLRRQNLAARRPAAGLRALRSRARLGWPLLLMELELIEPSMYLRMNADAPQRFAEAFDRYVRKKGLIAAGTNSERRL